MRSETIGLARLAVRQQVEIFGGDQVSLSSLWRAVGSPAGHDPERWAELAAPLLAGFTAYLDRLESIGASSSGSVAVVVDLGRRIEGSMAHRRPHEPRADRLVYASHLDSNASVPAIGGRTRSLRGESEVRIRSQYTP